MSDGMLSENALDFLHRRYFLKNDAGECIEDWDKLGERVVKAVMSLDKDECNTYYDKMYEMIHSLSFLPNSPTLFNAGTSLGTLSGCFVLPVADDMSGILDAVKWGGLIHQSGGGTGFSFTKVRPKGSLVKSTQGIASGPLSFIQIFNTTTDVITQAGKRHGANMGILNIDHPDIIDFIKVKTDDPKAFNNFNFSVGISDAFMVAVAANGMWELTHPKYHEVKKIKARELWNLMIECAWKSGEPGMIFIDTINRDNPTPQYGPMIATNPCGETPLRDFESCNLGSINLTKFITPAGRIAWQQLEDVTRLAVRFLDNIVSVNVYPLPEIKSATLDTRKIGLGVMGYADMLLMKGVRYGSPRSINIAEKVMKHIQETAHDESAKLGVEKGYAPGCAAANLKRRNATLTTIAPTGSIAVIANVSSGVEPNYNLEKFRRRTGMVDDAGEQVVFTVRNEVYEQVKASNRFSKKELKDFAVTAHEVSVDEHLQVQAAFQKYTDNAVSKSINGQESMTKDAVDKIFSTAYTLGLKGVTVYRDKSRDNQVLSDGKGKASTRRVDIPEKVLTHLTMKYNITAEDLAETFECSVATIYNRLGELDVTLNRSSKKAVPDEVPMIKKRISTGLGTLSMMVSEDEDKVPLEIFLLIGKQGKELGALLEWGARWGSIALRNGATVFELIEQAEGIGSDEIHIGSDGICKSIPDAIAKALKTMYGGDTVTMVKSNLLVNKCPYCEAELINNGGCIECSKRCGYSKC